MRFPGFFTWSAFLFLGVAPFFPSLHAEISFAEGTLGEGTRWETPFHIIESNNPGPTVLITGGLHGNEPAGARAAEQIRHWPILRGRLVVLPRANQPGLRAGTRHLPELAKSEADLNRNFPRTGADGEALTDIGRAIWNLVRKH
ncbi:MAG: succinylglutamate desuccinylase/aspartoacylase family protein, partial [Roseibacillus sp.]|nr:succinylglutamate desuccinylase/aspartoacylase family protein [Roseibacillus sp.]